MEQKELLQEFEKKFNEMKKELNFNCTLKQLDEIFFIKDYILASKFVSPKLSRMICARIRDTYGGWIKQIHDWLLPSPYSMIANYENQIFNDKEKQELDLLMKRFLAFVSENVVIGLIKDKQKEAHFIDNSVKIWKENLPRLIFYSKKVNEYWNKTINSVKNK